MKPSGLKKLSVSEELAAPTSDKQRKTSKKRKDERSDVRSSSDKEKEKKAKKVESSGRTYILKAKKWLR